MFHKWNNANKWVNSLNNKFASDWLKGLPSRNIGTCLSDEEFRYALCLRLGMKAYTQHSCKCGLMVDPWGRHAFSCKKNNGKMVRHTIVNKIIHQGFLTPSSLQNFSQI